MLNSIEYKEIKKKIYIPFDTNNSSKLYKNNDIIYKFPYIIAPDLKQNLQYIDKCNLECIIKIIDLIYRNEKFIGYSFEYYKDYKSLRRYRNSKIQDKIEVCYKIIETFNKIFKYNLLYSDYHTGNILLNKETNDIKICDIDNFFLSNDIDLKISSLKSVAILVLMYLYNLSYADIYVLRREMIPINKDNLIDEYFKNLSSYNLSDFSDTLGNLDKDLIIEESSQLKRKALILSKNSYYKKYYTNF